MSERKEGDRQSNGRHALREVYEAKRAEKLAMVGIRRLERCDRGSLGQFDILNKRLGVGIGAKKERARLKLQILTFVGGEIVTSMEGNRAAKELAIAKMESLGYRIMRRLGLSPRTPEEYEEEKYAAHIVGLSKKLKATEISYEDGLTRGGGSMV